MPIVIPSRDWGDLESPWISTDLSTWETPLRHGRLRDYQPREQVFRQGEDFSSVYIVESGRVRVSVCHADGQEKTLYVADTGAMIGESDCILGQPYSSTATVVLPSRVRAVPSALVQELFHADPVFMFQQNHLCALPGSKNGSRHSGCSCSHYDYFILTHPYFPS